MQNRLRILWIILSILTLAALGARIKAAPVDLGIPDTVSIDSVTAYQSGSGVVPVRFFNDHALTAVEITLKKNSSEVALDSVSFVGGRLESLAGFKGLSRNSDGSFTVWIYPSENIPAGSGLFCRMYYSYANSITPQTVTIDTTTFVDGQLEHSTSFADSTFSGPYAPKFRPGYLNIQTSPPTFDSLWVANIIGARGQRVALDVSMYNERNVKSADIALTYGSSRLIYDSVSFAGTRGAQANISGSVDDATHSLYIGLSYGDGTPLAPGSGIVARVHFTISPIGTDTVITIDTTTYLSLLSTAITLTSIDADRRIVPIFNPGSVSIQGSTDVDDGTEPLPTAYELSQNYPNPFNPTTEIAFALPAPGETRLEIYNIMGQRVRVLASGFLPAGNHQITFDGRSDRGLPLASGVYFYRLSSGAYSQARKMMLVK